MHRLACITLLLAVLQGPPAQAHWFEPDATPEGLPLEVLRADQPIGTVILAHGCSGPVLTRDRGWAQRLANAGFNTVAFDSWAWRGLAGGVCQTDAVTGEDRVQEVALVVKHLQSQAWHAGPVHLLGWSHGGTVALATSVRQMGVSKAVAMYPWCEQRFAAPVIPVQIHIGSHDDWTPPHRCSGLYRGLFTQSALGQYFEYEGAFHNFDSFIEIDRRYTGRGERGELASRRLKSDPAARDRAIERVAAFFKG